MKKIHLFIGLVFSILSFSQGGPGGSCATIASFCGDASLPFNNVTNTASLGNIGCLGTSPNGAWYTFQVSTPGQLDFQISQTNAAGTGIDVDFICWGPFTVDPRLNPSLCTTSLQDYPDGSNASANNIVACSYLPDAIENFTVTGAVAGNFYVVLITNFANASGSITFDQTNNTGGANGSTNCEICGVTLDTDRFICDSSVSTVTLTAIFYSPPTTVVPLIYRWYLNGVLQTTTPTNTLVVTQNGLWRVEVDRVACTPTEYDEVTVIFSSGITSNIIGPYSGPAGECNPTFDLTSYLNDLMTPANPANYTYVYYDLSDGSQIVDPTNFTPTASTQVLIQITQGSCGTYSDPIDIIVDCVPATCSLVLTSPASTTSQSVCLNQSITDILYTAGGDATGVNLITGAFPIGVTGSFVSGVYTISGIPTQLGNFSYTIETVGCATNIQLSGTIVVTDLPSLTTLSSNTPICSGNNAVFSLVGTPNSTVTYTLNGNATPVLTVLLDASGNGTVTINSATTNNTIDLSNITIGSCNTVLSNTQTVVIQVQPNAGTNGTLTVCQGTTPTNAELFAELGGTPDTTGTWSNSGLVYTYTVNAIAPCTVNATATVTITEQAQPNAGTNGTLTVCAGTTPTNADLFAELGGTPSATGTWSNSGLVYTYTVNAVAPCTVNATATVTITEQAQPNAGTNGTLTVCQGTTPTNAELFAELGGTPSATGTWSNSGLVYTYTVNAVAPCTVNATATVTVTEQTQPNAGTNGALTVCQGTTPTNAELFAELGGTPDTTGTWGNSGLVYTYTVNAIAPCTGSVSATVTVTEQAQPNAGTNGTLTVCAGTTPTNAQLFAQLGGTPNTTGTWSNSGLVYTYTVNAVAPCTVNATATVTVTEQAQPNAGTNGTLTVCQGTTPTNADLFAELGGTPSATGTWSNSGLVYTYTVNAIAPCTVNATATVTVIEQAQPNAGTNGTLTVCQGTTPTNAELFAELGGTPDTTGTWSNSGLVYTYTVNAIAPCTGSVSATVTVTEQAQPNAGTNGTLTVCQGTTPTNAQLFAELGGTPSATGTWSNSGLVYTYTVNAIAPCTVNATATVTVTEQAQPDAGTNGALTVCQGTTPTNAELFAELGGTPDTTGTWSNSGLVYTYTVNAITPCTGSVTATVTVTEQAQPNAGTNGALTVCQGTTPTNAELFAELGGTPNTTGTWSNSGLVYTYTVNAVAPCTVNATATVTVTEQAQPNAGTNGTLTVCQGTTPTNADLFAQLGGTPDTTGTWSNSGLVYTYTVNAIAPCTVNATATVTVTEQAQPNAGTNGTLTVCQGTTPTNAELFAELGGTPSATGTWSNSGLVYTYTVNAVAPCTVNATATVTVTEQAQPNAGTNGTLTVCQGTTPTNADLFAELGGTPSATGTWSNSGLVYTYTVNAVAPCTVNATATVTITEQAQPNAGTNGTLTVCQGTTPTNAELFAELGGTPSATGTWSNSGLVYTYTVNAIAPCTGSVSATVTVTEQAQPNAGTNGTLTVCAGTTPTNAQLFAQLGGTPNTTGTWSNSGLVYTYTVNAVAPCTVNATATVTVTEQAQPNAGTNGTLTVCVGTTPTNAQLFAQLGGTPSSTGTWSNSGLVYTYTVNAVAPCTGSATATVTVTEQAQPNAGTNGTLTVCQGTTPTNAELFAELGGTPNTTGTWSNSGLVYTYTVNAIAPCTGSVSATVTVTEQAQPNAGTNGTLTVCQGTTPTNAQLFAELGGTPSATGTWSNSGLVYTYTVNAVSPCTVNATATVTVTEQAQPDAGTNGALTVCQGTTPTNAQLFAQLGGTPDTTGTWSNSGLVYTYTVNPIAPCTGSALTSTVTVTEQVQPNAGTNGILTVCAGTTPTYAELFAQLGGTPDTTGTWSNSGLVYTYTVNAIAPCTVNATATVTITEQVQPNAGTDGTLTVCQGVIPTYAELFAQLGGTPDTTGTWSNSGLVYTYTVNATAPCTVPSTATVTVNVTIPATSITTTVSAYFSENSVVVVNVQDGNGTFLYQIDDEGFQTSNMFTGVSAGSHTITVIDTLGCTYLTAPVFLIDYPKFFTPNGDGYNDTWNIKGLNQADAKLYIFDRYGKLIKQLSVMDTSQGWDGTFNGQPLPSTDYWFSLDYNEGTQRREFRAHFTLKR